MHTATNDTRESDDTTGQISENIRYLVSRTPSISAAAKQLGINRQQLNKYLNGSSRPSLRTLRRIATVFDVPTEALTLPLEALRQKVGHSPDPRQTLRSPDLGLIQNLTDAHDETATLLEPYCGRYFRYNCVPVLTSHVLRAYVEVFQKDGFTYARVFERFAAAGSPWSRALVRRNIHILSYVQDRIQFIDCGTPGGDPSPGFSMFYPIYTTGVQYLSGTLLGSFSFGARPIYSSNVVMQRLPATQSLRGDLLACGLVTLDDPSLGPEVRQRLCQADGTPSIQLAG